MSVLIPNATATVRRQAVAGLNTHGEREQGNWGSPIGEPLDALIKQRGDGSWVVGVDPDLWPVREGDLVVDAIGREFLVQTADLLTNAADDTVNWVRCTALRKAGVGVEPTAPWFVARHIDVGDIDPIEIADAGMLTGYGPPPDDLDIAPGVEYVDLSTGDVYQSQEGP